MTQVAEQPHPLVGGGQVVQHGLEQVQGEAHGQVAGITQVNEELEKFISNRLSSQKCSKGWTEGGRFCL